MNLPNKLTLSRFVLTAAFVGAMVSEAPGHESLATGLFVAAGLTDLLDGVIARRRKAITNFGILMDPLADKVLVSAAFISFVGRQWIPAWMAVVVVARELAITGLRLLAASKNLVLAAESAGKHKTTWQIIAIVSVLVVHSYPRWGAVPRTVLGWPLFGREWSHLFAELALWVAILTTVYSGAVYLWRNRQVYLRDL
jgi:CDP-diacylglycerol--glycerol-3-phosphate 3-phosphatidyltransferase